MVVGVSIFRGTCLQDVDSQKGDVKAEEDSEDEVARTPASLPRAKPPRTPAKSKGRFAYRDVVHKKSTQTTGGLTAKDIVVSNVGKYVSKARSQKAKKQFVQGSPFQLFAHARENVRIKFGLGMIMCGGKTPAGQRFLELARLEYQELKRLQPEI